MKYKLISLLFLLTSCTYSVNLVHTEGEAMDVVDEQQTPSNEILPDMTIPLNMV